MSPRLVQGEVPPGGVRCPRCRGAGASPNPQDHRWVAMDRKDGEAGPRQLEVARHRARCTLCNGRGAITAYEVDVFNSGR